MKISIVIPNHNIPEREVLLKRNLDSIKMQTFTDYEIVLNSNGLGMAKNTNEGIRKAKGEIIKILFMDDFFYHKNSLKNIVESFKGGWLATGCLHSDDGVRIFNHHLPSYHEKIHEGVNTIGSPSVIAFENKEPILFDENLTWLLDCDLYKRIYERYGEPTLLSEANVVIGLGSHQETNKISDFIKRSEGDYLLEKYHD